MKAHVMEPAVVVQSRIERLISKLRGTLSSEASAARAWFSVALLGAVVLVTVAHATAAEPLEARTASQAPAQSETVAVFSGDYVRGVPVYRLPRMTVVARRQTELAKGERQGQPTRAGEARARVTARPAV